jgi:hypothetical protein
MKPGGEQSCALEQMMAVLSPNPSACALAERVCRFFDQKVAFTLASDGTTKYSLPGASTFLKSRNPHDLQPTIHVRKSARTIEALVHELLHLDLILEGYPRFLILAPRDTDDCDLGLGITNNADHVLMRPKFLAMGYRNEAFTGDTRPLSESETVVLNVISKLSPVCTPEEFLRFVSNYLRSSLIRFESFFV